MGYHLKRVAGIRALSCAALCMCLLSGLLPAAGKGAAAEIAAPGIPKEVTLYARALEALGRSSERTGLTTEGVFAKGMEASRALLRGGLMEGFTPKMFEETRALMQGFRLNREEILFAQPEPAFFLKLSLERGQRHDVAFFETYIRTYPAGVLPVYKQMVTDYSACTVYGEMHLVDLYGRWRGFIRAFPGRYSSFAGDVMKDIRDQLVRGTCACGSRETVRRELEEFTKTYPEDDIAEDIGKRLAGMDSGATKIRFNCLPM